MRPPLRVQDPRRTGEHRSRARHRLGLAGPGVSGGGPQVPVRGRCFLPPTHPRPRPHRPSPSRPPTGPPRRPPSSGGSDAVPGPPWPGWRAPYPPPAREPVARAGGPRPRRDIEPRPHRRGAPYISPTPPHPRTPCPPTPSTPPPQRSSPRPEDWPGSPLHIPSDPA